MTCYLRFHEVLVGVRTPERAIDWDAVVSGWQRATTVAHRDQLLSTMALEPIDVYDLPSADLGRFSGLVVSDRVDQEFLHQERDTIRGLGALVSDRRGAYYSQAGRLVMFQLSPADDGTRERQEGFVYIRTAIVAYPQAPKLVQPTQRAVDDPAVDGELQEIGRRALEVTINVDRSI